MKNYWLFLIITIVASGCHKDVINESTKEETINPINLNYQYIEGQVTDDLGNPINSAVIEVLQDHELIGTTVSESNGSYSTRNIIVKPNRPIVLKYAKDQYEFKYREFENYEEDIIKKNVTLANTAEIQSLSNEKSSPLDTSLVKIYGYAAYANGNPASGVSCRAIWDYQDIITGVINVIEHSDDLTDIDGYWEMYVAKDTMINLRAFDWGNEIISFCQFDFNPDYPNSNNSLGDFSFPYVDIGSYSEDTEVELNQEVEWITKRSTVSGRISLCDGSPIEAGNLKIHLGRKTDDFVFSLKIIEYKDYQFGSNGEFEVTIETCDQDNMAPEDWGVGVFAHDTIANWSGIQAFDFEPILNAGETLLCWDQNDYPGELTVNFEGETYVNSNFVDDARSGQQELRTGATVDFGDQKISFYIAADTDTNGAFRLVWLKMWILEFNDPYWTVVEYPFEEEPPEDAIISITEVDGNWLEGTINGTVADGKPIFMEFRVYNK